MQPPTRARTTFGGITFELEKKEAMEGELRQKAVADARSRAEALAKLTVWSSARAVV